MSSATPRLQVAYYYDSVERFLSADPDAIYGQLGKHHAHSQELAQRSAWLEQIRILQLGLRSVPEAWIAFEFAIPRMGKRADVIVVLAGIIFVIEFKIDAEAFTNAAIEQAIDYASDLKDFHATSHDRIIIPVVIATDASPKPVQLSLYPDEVAEPIFSNGMDLDRFLLSVVRRFGTQVPLTGEQWISGSYKPTPTIIEAAQALYRSHRVEEIIRHDAGKKNLSVTNNRISEIIEEAKAQNHKAICFVTGVPGAGKTLAGLNLATQRAQMHEDEHAVFLSGNGPLVAVLREALARDENMRGKEIGQPISMGNARRKVSSFIQNIHHFRDHNLRTDDAPSEHVVVFDEAQRAWNLDKIGRFMKEKHGLREFDQSEPDFLISVMDRHRDWCAIVCLIGGGQEINDGEAGLTEWFDALSSKYRDWKIFASDQLTHADYHWGRDLVSTIRGLDYHIEDDLHLSVALRSFRAETLSDFVNAVVAGETAEARNIYGSIGGNYPIRLTRQLSSARIWLRAQARGSARFGLVASSRASRLKPEGVNVHEKIDAPYWFLNSREDVRSSFYLEDPATEFDIQGLELDWIGVCWDADFRRVDGRWSHHDFQGTKWKNVNSDARKAYLVNTYRVLLTRARQGMVIYVPLGDQLDPTRSPDYYSAIASYLEECGIPKLEDTEQEVLRKVDLA
jgi:hypothetical protein